MNKKIWGAALIATMAIAAGWNYQQNKQCVELSDLASANVEALASGEGTNPGDPCYTGSYNSSLPEATKCDQPCKKQRCGGDTDKCY
ncbi:NVEALA domain-containing protein [Parabacteroides chongii]|uniref:NVEALA domain-containing protein n=1 Tax=Parabacteroides chongii TaxID=2685834 RepID=UPI00240DCA95|nr:NVEALA domain-containing protein [Parabacteroides chongii]WFE86598.1 NVEALA domain-containing protein [Parabacteroides chongii]